MGEMLSVLFFLFGEIQAYMRPRGDTGLSGRYFSNCLQCRRSALRVPRPVSVKCQCHLKMEVCHLNDEALVFDAKNWQKREVGWEFHLIMRW